MTQSESIFRLEGVTQRYGDLTALDAIDFEAHKNEYISLLGPSGAGKTSLLRVIAGFEKPSTGRVWFEGRDITGLAPHERGIGFVFQNFALFPHLTVFENVAFGLRNGAATVAGAEIERRVTEAIEMVGLEGLADRGVDQISGGQKQRVALARTLVMQPRLVLLDEPLGALDANLRDRMQNELRAIREKLDVTFLHVTGSETEALAMGDTVAVLSAGKVVQSGSSAEVYDSPATPEVAYFLNRFNIFDGKLEADTFKGPFGDAPAPNARKASRDVYAIRYDRMKVCEPGAAPPGPSLTARFVTSEYLGSSVMYFFDTPDHKTIEVEHHLSFGEPEEYSVGQDYALHWNPDQAIVFGKEGSR